MVGWSATGAPLRILVGPGWIARLLLRPLRGPHRRRAQAGLPDSSSGRSAARIVVGPKVSDMVETIQVRERGQTLEFSYTDLLRYAGPHSPGGVANAFKAMQRAFPVLSPDVPPQRRSIVIRTAFRGPGARDGFEAVTRAVTDGRYTVDRALVRPDRGRLLEDFVFNVGIDNTTVTLLLRAGFVSEQFIDLVRTPDRTLEQERRLDALKLQLAQSVMGATAAEVYDID